MVFVKKLPLSVLLLILAPLAASAMQVESWNFDLAFTWQYNAEIGTQDERKQPSTLMFNPGFSAYLVWNGESGGFFMQPAVWLSFGNWQVYEDIARPCGEEKIDHMKVLGLMLDAPFGYTFRPDKNMRIGVQGGPALYLRIPLWTAELGTAEPSEFWTAFYAGGEFLYLSLASWLEFTASEKMDFSVGLRMYQSISTFWTAAPVMHGFQVGLTASLRFTSRQVLESQS